jgi:TPR repeat protein
MERVDPNPSLEKPNYQRLPLPELLRRVEQQDPEAFVTYAYNLKFGIALPSDVQKSEEYFIKAAMAGHPVALSFCFRFGLGTSRNEERSLKLYQEASERNHPIGKHARTHARTHACTHARTHDRRCVLWLTA